jgi:uncharacterized repeat protein (TIGR01451 family)
MSKKILAILALVVITVALLAGCGQEPPSGEISETPLPSSPAPSDSGTVASIPDDSSESTPPATTIAAPSTLTVLSISVGDVLVMKAGTDEWIEAQVGMSIEAGDSLKSGNDSTAEVTFFDGSTIELEPGTQIQVTTLDIAADTGATTILIKQEIGDTISRVTKLTDPASRYEVETPAGIAAVRGSVMLVEVLSSGKTKVTNIEGDIRAISGGEEVPIPEGRICSITPGQPPKLTPTTTYFGGGGGGSKTITTDLALAKSDSPDPVDPGAELTYTLQITNNGPSDSTGAVIVDALPPLEFISFVSATDDGTYDPDSNTVSWAIGALADNDSTSVSITVLVDISTLPGVIENTATVSANENDDDSTNDSAIEETTINDINDPPVAEDDIADTEEDTPVIIDVLANDSDIDVGDTLSVSEVTQGANGSVTNNGGDVTYTPNSDFNGSDSFTYTVSDGNGGGDTATVNVTVNPVNDPPVAEDDIADTEEDTPVTIDVLANDSDIDGGTLTVSEVTQGANGLVTNNGGDVTYTPNADFNGSDSFTYTVSDGNGGTDTATVNVTVIRTHAVIEIIVDAPIEASLYIWDETESQYAIDRDTQNPVDGTSRSIPCSVKVAGGHCYTVWILKDGYIFSVRHDPIGWDIVDVPEGGVGTASSGCADEAITYQIWFDVIN